MLAHLVGAQRNNAFDFSAVAVHKSDELGNELDHLLFVFGLHVFVGDQKGTVERRDGLFSDHNELVRPSHEVATKLFDEQFFDQVFVDDPHRHPNGVDGRFDEDALDFALFDFDWFQQEFFVFAVLDFGVVVTLHGLRGEFSDTEGEVKFFSDSFVVRVFVHVI